jgi:ABC-type phosphate/phosphonate transport system substrate-binding protein
LRHHLLRFRTPERPMLYSEVVGPLVTARAVLDAVIEGRIDVGPLDAYWHLMIQRHRPELLAQIRVIDTTDLAPIPAFVTGRATPFAEVTRLGRAFATAAGAPWFPPLAAILCLKGFAVVERRDFAPTLALALAAEGAGYPMPG